MKTGKLILSGVLAVALGLTSSGLTKAEGGNQQPPVGNQEQPGDNNNAPVVEKVSLKVRVFDGKRLLFTFVPYKEVPKGTAVSLAHLQEVVKIDGYDIQWKGHPTVLDKDYTMEVQAVAKGTQQPGDNTKLGGNKQDPKQDQKKDTGKKYKALPKTSAVK